MRRAARILFLLLAPLIAPLSVAFIIDIHKSITQAVLTGMSPQFSPSALEEVKNANECVDLGVALFGVGDEMDQPCISSVLISQPAWHQQFRAPEDHFDDETILKGAARLRMLRARVVEYAKKGQFIEARKLLGMGLHTVQDFYSHTNWVEMGNTDILAALEVPSAPIPQSRSDVGDPKPAPGSWRLAGGKEDVCNSRIIFAAPNYIKKIYTGSLIPGKSMADDKTGQRGYVLTSGFFFEDGGDPNVAKCRHGSWVDQLVIAGINKDELSSQSLQTLHPQAQRLAALHTRAFVQYVFDQLKDFKDNPGALAGLTGTEPTGCDCPNPVSEHIHEHGWFDVNSQKMNDTGLKVKAGDLIKFEVNPKGLISWGRTMTLFGEEMLARPQGDSDVTPGNHIGWVQPPMPRYPIGMLFGAVVLDSDVSSTPGIFDKMIPFAIGAGPVGYKMSRDGKLFLSVNDGYLGNNRGCFQVKITRQQ